MLLETIKEYKLLLGSKSPRRKELLRNAGFDFVVINIDTEESYDTRLKPKKVAEFLSKKKALAYGQELEKNEILITSDTIVVYKGNILGKPNDSIEAKQMLAELSAKSHKVITGFCLRSKDRIKVYSAVSKVTFSDLSVEEIDYYVDSYKPMDKA
jgi:septum formation protein